MKAVDTGLKVLSWLFTFESGSTSSPDQVNWPRLQGRVEQSVENINAELHRIGSIARFLMLKKEAGLEIYLNRAEYSPDTYLADPHRESMPVMEALVDKYEGLGLMLPHNPGPRPAGMTRKHLSEAQVVDEIGRNFRHSLNYQDCEKLRDIATRDKSLRAFGFQ